MSEHFPGWPRPGYTQVPNLFFDQVMPDLTLAETRVLLYVIRRTVGFQRDAAAISIAQIRSGLKRRDGTPLDRGTGLGRTAVTDALRSLIEKGMLVASRNASEEYGTRPTTYALRFAEGESTSADGGVHSGDMGASAPADHLPIEERKPGERKSDATEVWQEILEVLERGEHFNARNLATLAAYPVHLDGETLVVRGDPKWTAYVGRAAAPRRVRFAT